MKLIKGLNFALIVLIIIFSIRLISQFSAITGKATYYENDYMCDFYNDNEINPIPLDYCCSQIQSQLRCDKQENYYKCYVVEDDKYYLINEKTKNYCEKEGYAIEQGS